MDSKFGISSRTLFLVATLGIVLFSREVLGQKCHVVETDVGNEPGLATDICSINDGTLFVLFNLHFHSSFGSISTGLRNGESVLYFRIRK